MPTSTWPRADRRTSRQLHAFLSDTVLLTGVGFEPPIQQASLGRTSALVDELSARPRIGILFYRAQYAAGNTAYVEALADAIDAAGGMAFRSSRPHCGMRRPIWWPSSARWTP